MMMPVLQSNNWTLTYNQPTTKPAEKDKWRIDDSLLARMLASLGDDKDAWAFPDCDVLPNVADTEAADLTKLRAAAQARDERAFVAILEDTNWNDRPADDYAEVIRLALQIGALPEARNLLRVALDAGVQNHTIHTYSRVLAPTRIIATDGPSRGGYRANRDWLNMHVDKYRGRWVALREGRLLAVANSMEELIQQLDNTTDTLLTKVM